MVTCYQTVLRTKLFFIYSYVAILSLICRCASLILTLYSSVMGLYQILRGNIWLLSYFMLQDVHQLVTNWVLLLSFGIKQIVYSVFSLYAKNWLPVVIWVVRVNQNRTSEGQTAKKWSESVFKPLHMQRIVSCRFITTSYVIHLVIWYCRHENID